MTRHGGSLPNRWQGWAGLESNHACPHGYLPQGRHCHVRATTSRFHRRQPEGTVHYPSCTSRLLSVCCQQHRQFIVQASEVLMIRGSARLGRIQRAIAIQDPCSTFRLRIRIDGEIGLCQMAAISQSLRGRVSLAHEPCLRESVIFTQNHRGTEWKHFKIMHCNNSNPVTRSCVSNVKRLTHCRSVVTSQSR